MGKGIFLPLLTWHLLGGSGNPPLLAANDAVWPNWRGPRTTASTLQGNHPIRTGSNSVAWKLELPGKGGSCPVVWNQTIFLTTPSAESNGVMAVSLEGKQKWLTRLGPQSPAKHRTLGSSCNSSPVTDGKTVFAYFRSGEFAAIDVEGKVRWRLNLNDRFGQEQLYWDQGSSPVLTDTLVVVARLHQGESWLAAFDKSTGELKWQQPRNFKVPSENDNGYTTPVLFRQGGKEALLLWGADHLTAHDAVSGKLLWSAGGFNPGGTANWPAIASPLIVNRLAIVPVGRDDRPRQAQVHAIRLGGSGDVSETHRAWIRDDVGVFVPSPAEYGGRIYLLRHKGEIVCLDPKTGHTVWSESLPKDRAPYYSSPVIANGVLYALREDGVLFAARVGKRCEILGETVLGERVVSSPAPAGNRLLVRGDKHLFCLQ